MAFLKSVSHTFDLYCGSTIATNAWENHDLKTISHDHDMFNAIPLKFYRIIVDLYTYWCYNALVALGATIILMHEAISYRIMNTI